MSMRRVLSVLLVVVPSVVDAAPSATMTRAIQLYARKDYIPATVELTKVVDGETGDPAEVQRAEFFLAKSMYYLGLYAPSLVLLDRIARTPNHTYRVAGLKWIVAMSRAIGDDNVLEPIQAYTVAELDDPNLAEARWTAHYLFGLSQLRHGDFDGARAVLEPIPDGASAHERGLVARGFALLGQHEDANAVAVWAKVGGEPGDVAALATGELALRAGEWDKAVAAFRRVSPTGTLARRAAWEASWSQLRARHIADAGDDLFAPSTTDPESLAAMDVPWLLNLEVCAASQPTGDVIAAFRDETSSVLLAVDKLLADHDDNADLFDRVVVPARVGAGFAGPRQLGPYLHTLMWSPPIAAAMAWDDELRHELETLASSDRAWQTTKVASDVLQELTVMKSVTDANAGKLARDRLVRVRHELTQLLHSPAKLPAGRGGSSGGLAVSCGAP
jgi:hypothetical protein